MNKENNIPLVRVHCVCGRVVPITVITEDEPEADIREHYLNKVVLKCFNCYTITEVSGSVKKAIDDAYEIATRSGSSKNVYLS